MKKLLFCLATLSIVSGSIAAIGTCTRHDTEGDNNIRFQEVAY